MPDFVKKLLDNNQKWVANKLKEDPGFFEILNSKHEPKVLWIGCSDARVPANEITGTLPGDVFVHRNISNMVVHSDMNMLSVLSYAVEVLNIRHIIVCGHYSCGGILAAMSNKSFGLIDNWLRHIKDVYRSNSDELEAIKDEKARYNRLVELNVQQQVYNLCKSSIVQAAWNKGQFPYIHGWVYDVHDGILRDLNVTFNNNDALSHMYKFEGI
ncbi:MAG TPA: carbonate dehydratase [Bacteroidia bacterium]|nr:carbonate dehydratase [Bacteroidia bacterium]